VIASRTAASLFGTATGETAAPAPMSVPPSRPPGPYLPIPLAYLIGLAVVTAILFGLLFVDVVGYAYSTLGLSSGEALAVIVATLLGSSVNIPVARVDRRSVLPAQVVRIFGIPYAVPQVPQSAQCIVAVNLGGAVIPTAVSAYVIAHDRHWLLLLAEVAVTTIIVHRAARPVEGLGIAVPSLLPPVAAATLGVLLSQHDSAALAYVGGTLGTLIGADLLNLRRVGDLGAPIASIGGAGTFDAVFWSGIAGVLLASALR
jgi:uncharacterized membrane protein